MTNKKRVVVGVGIVGSIAGLLLVAARQAKAAEPGVLPLQLSNIEARSPVAVGRTFWVTVDAFNPNDFEITDTITMTLPWEDSKEVTVGPGETQFVAAFSLQFDTPGEYVIRLDGLEITVVIMAVLPVLLSNLRAAPQVVTVGEEVRITIDVANPNFDDILDYTVIMTGALTGTEQLTLQPHQSIVVEFIRTVTWEGRRDVFIGDLAVAVTGEAVPSSRYCDPFDGHCYDTRAEMEEHIVYEHLGWGPPSDSPNESYVVSLAIGLWSVENAIIDAERRGEDTSNLELAKSRYLYSIANCRSGELLILSLSVTEKYNLIAEMTSRGIEDANSIVFGGAGYGGTFWIKYVRVDELAPGWTP